MATLAFDAKRAYCNNTGLGNYSRTLLTSLARGHRDTAMLLLTPRTAGRHERLAEAEANLCPVLPRGLWRLLPGLWRTLGAGLHGLRPDLYHGLSHELPLCLPRSTRRVVTVHDLIAWRYPQQFSAADRVLHRLKIRHACRTAHAVVAISQQTKRDLTELLHVPEDKIEVIYQSCHESFRQPVGAADRAEVRRRYGLSGRYVVAVGTIERRKNQAAVVEALALLPDGDVTLLIVGRRTAYCAEVEAAIAAHGLQGRVQLVHDAPFSLFPALYAEAEASIYMSRYEGFGIPVLESLCCGTPVLTSRCSSMPEAGGDAALYADPQSPADMAAQLHRLLADDELRRHLGQRATAHIALFEPQNVARQYWQLYLKTLAAQP